MIVQSGLLPGLIGRTDDPLGFFEPPWIAIAGQGQEVGQVGLTVLVSTVVGPVLEIAERCSHELPPGGFWLVTLVSSGMSIYFDPYKARTTGF